MTKHEQVNIVVVGHVDHGKSTVIGRLLHDTGSLPKGKIEYIRSQCKKNSRPFEYAFLLDALKDEQSQGVTIDTARCFFKTKKRDYIIIDAPGHVEFLKNMLSGATRAEAALLVIDAHDGIAENSKRHGYLISMIGISQIVILVNKMDLVDNNKFVFEQIVNEYSQFLNQLGIKQYNFVPVSARNGDNLSKKSKIMSWYNGETLLELIDGFSKHTENEKKAFRLPVQDIYKFTEYNDNRRIIAGTVESGNISVGDRVVFYPSGSSSYIKTIEQFNASPKQKVGTGYATGFTLQDELFIKCGEIMCRSDQPAPKVSSQFKANIFWMGKSPMIKGKKYKLKLGSNKSYVRLLEIISCIDAVDLSVIETKNQIERHDVAECVFETVKPFAFDLVKEFPVTSRFVIVDNYDIAGGGIITESNEEISQPGKQMSDREISWDKGGVSMSERVFCMGHKSKFIVVCGKQHVHKIAKELELFLFRKKIHCYYLGINNMHAGKDSYNTDAEVFREEHLYRLGEIGQILTDAGLIFISAIEDAEINDIELLRKLNAPNGIFIVGVGSEKISFETDISFEGNEDLEHCCTVIINALEKI